MHQILVLCVILDRKKRYGAPMQHEYDFVVQRISAVQDAEEACTVEHARQASRCA